MILASAFVGRAVRALFYGSVRLSTDLDGYTIVRIDTTRVRIDTMRVRIDTTRATGIQTQRRHVARSPRTRAPRVTGVCRP